ncbi:MAG: hypothetical protein ACXVX9_12040 [Mycobacteriaceae bacterium]
MRKPTKRVAVLIAAAVVLGGGGIAYAYWTAGGSGTGTATTGTNTPITANQTTVITGLAPGVAAQIISGTFTNNNSGPVYVGTVTASIGSVTKAGGAPAGTCDATDYALASPAMTVNAEVPAGTAQSAWTGATIAFNDNAAANQDACKGATVTLSYAIS